MRKLHRALSLTWIVALLAFTSACDSDDTTPSSLPIASDGGSEASDGGPGTQAVAIACADAFDALYTRPESLPAFGPTQRGDIVRCSFDKAYSASEMQGAAYALGYRGPELPSGAKVYRIVYRTQRVARADGTAQDALSGALVFIPDKPRTTEPQPLVVVAHGAVGIGDQCNPSRRPVTEKGTDWDDFHATLLPAVGYGFPVIAPDYAGFGFVGESHSWLLAEDEAKSLLDATRAMKKLLKPGVLGSKVAMLGHSQGGHAVLSAQALAKSYGMEGELVGVIALAPFWFTVKAFGAVISELAGVKTDASGVWTVAYMLDYFYGHGEVLDGVGHGLDLFQEDKKAAIKNTLTKQCLVERTKAIAKIAELPKDFLLSAPGTAISECAIMDTCSDPVAALWRRRFQADRPGIDPNGAKIAIWAGGKDTSVPYDRIRCGLDKITADLAKVQNPTSTLTVCVDPGATHGAIGLDSDYPAGIMRKAAHWANQWIAARTLGEAEAPACGGEADLKDADGNPVACSALPSNVD